MVGNLLPMSRLYKTMNKTNLTTYFEERNWERKYGMVFCLITSAIGITILALIY